MDPTKMGEERAAGGVTAPLAWGQGPGRGRREEVGQGQGHRLEGPRLESQVKRRSSDPKGKQGFSGERASPGGGGEMAGNGDHRQEQRWRRGGESGAWALAAVPGWGMSTPCAPAPGSECVWSPGSARGLAEGSQEVRPVL